MLATMILLAPTFFGMKKKPEPVPEPDSPSIMWTILAMLVCWALPLLLLKTTTKRASGRNAMKAPPPAARKRVVNPDGVAYANRGLRPCSGAQPTKVSAFTASREGALPAKVDLRPYCSPVEDQKASNSCSANAVAGAYEYLNMRHALQSGDEPGDISRLFIYYVGRKIDQKNWGDPDMKPKDEGVTLSGAIEAMQLKGACLETSYPFDLAMVNECPPGELFEKARNFKVSHSRSLNVDLDKMRQCLAEGFPIIFGLKLTKAFFSPPASGRIKTPNPDDPQSAEHGLHAMLLVGYMDREQVFIVRNSWGPDWGVGGYVYVPYNYVANSEFNMGDMFAIEGLTDVDLTPDDDDGEDGLDGEEEEDGELELGEEEDDEQDDEEEEGFNGDDFFSPLAEARRVFTSFDADGSGEIDSRELFNALRLMGVRVRPHETRAFLAALDTDSSGTLTFLEFCRFLQIEA